MGRNRKYDSWRKSGRLEDILRLVSGYRRDGLNEEEIAERTGLSQPTMPHSITSPARPAAGAMCGPLFWLRCVYGIIKDKNTKYNLRGVPCGHQGNYLIMVTI